MKHEKRQIKDKNRVKYHLSADSGCIHCFIFLLLFEKKYVSMKLT